MDELRPYSGIHDECAKHLYARYCRQKFIMAIVDRSDEAELDRFIEPKTSSLE